MNKMSCKQNGHNWEHLETHYCDTVTLASTYQCSECYEEIIDYTNVD